MTRLSEVTGRNEYGSRFGGVPVDQASKKWRVTAPDGQAFEVTAPAGASQDEVMSYAQAQYAQGGIPTKSKFGGVPVSAPRNGARPFDKGAEQADAIEVEMPDGTILQFPGDTAPEVMQRVARQHHSENLGAPDDRAELEGLRRMKQLEDQAAGAGQPDRFALLLEAERRGILPPDKAALLTEARKRGLVPVTDPAMLAQLNAPPSRLQQIESALRKADAAGNTEDARALAQAYRQERDSGSAASGSTANRTAPQPLGRPWEKYQATPAQAKPWEKYSAAQPDAPAKPQGADWKRELGLGARNVATGITDVLGIVGNPINYLASKATGNPYESMSDAAGRMLDSAGLPRPATSGERVASDAGRALTGSALTMGAGGLAGTANTVRGAIGRGLMVQPGLQAFGAVTGALAAGVTRENGGTQGEQTLASLAGGFSPAAARFGVSGLARLAARGGQAGQQQMMENMRAFNSAGTQPTVGQATQSRALQGAESLLSKAPGSSGVMARKGEAQQLQVANRVEALASQLSPRSSSTAAGRAIETGITGEGGFIDNFKAKSGQLYSQVDRYVHPASPVVATNTQSMLAREAALVPGAARVSELLSNPKLSAIRESLEADIAGNNGHIPYGALKQVRTKVGELISDNGLMSDIPTKALKRLYGALSDDMAVAVLQSGDPRAMQAFARANNYFRVGVKRIEAIESVLNKSGGPEAVYGAALSGTREGATKFRAVMQSLTPDSQKMVSAAMLRRLGRASNGQQNDLGDQFSINTFLTNWNGLSREARSAAFGRYGPKFASDVDQIARAASMVRKGSAVFSNPPGTAAAAVQLGSGGALVMSLLQGQFGVGAGIGGAMLTANGLARFLTNPARVAWLARTTRVPLHALGTQAIVLSGIAKREGDPELAEFARQLQQAANENGEPDYRYQQR